MAEDVVQNFIDALHELERKGEVDEWFVCSGRTRGSATSPRRGHSRDRTVPGTSGGCIGATSETSSPTSSGSSANEDGAALEWESRGVANNGEPFLYKGVTLLKLKGDKIAGFFSYFDPTGLGWQISRHREAGASP